MPRTSSTPRSQFNAGWPVPVPAAGQGLDPAQWRLLVRLPADVMMAAISVQDGGAGRTVPEGLAGLDAIAAGRGSDSDLVRAVVSAIFAQHEEPPGGPERPELAPAERQAQVLRDCRTAVELLRSEVDPADAAAYRHWVRQIAVRVLGAARSGGLLGLGNERLSAAEQAFLDQLGAVLV